MPESTVRNPILLSQADANALLIKHRKSIDYIIDIPNKFKQPTPEEVRIAQQAQMDAMAQLGLDPQAMMLRYEEFRKKDAELRKQDEVAARNTRFMGGIAFIATAIGTFLLRNKFIKDNKLIQGFFVGISSVFSWFVVRGLTWKIFGGNKVRKESNEFILSVRTAFERDVAQAIEEAETIRGKLKGPAGEVAINLGIMTPEQRDHALEIQSRFVALFDAQQPQNIDSGWERNPNAKALLDSKNGEEWKNFAEKNNISEANMRAAREIVINGQGKIMPKGSAPTMINIAVALGYTTSAVKDAILTAQAAEGVLQSVSTIQGEPLTTIIANPRWQIIGKDPGESAELQGAQAVHYLGAILGAASRQLAATATSDVKNKMSQAEDALEILSIASLQSAAITLHENHAEDAASQVGRIASYVAINKQKSADMSVEKLDRALEVLKVGLEAGRIHLGQIMEWPDMQVQEKLKLARNTLIPFVESPQQMSSQEVAGARGR